MVSHHEQQASKHCRKQQHRWPAYNLNLAPPQAATDGLFQQTRLISKVIQYTYPPCLRYDGAICADQREETLVHHVRDRVLGKDYGCEGVGANHRLRLR
jgi:hypothetical protein